MQHQARGQSSPAASRKRGSRNQPRSAMDAPGGGKRQVTRPVPKTASGCWRRATKRSAPSTAFRTAAAAADRAFPEPTRCAKSSCGRCRAVRQRWPATPRDSEDRVGAARRDDSTADTAAAASAATGVSRTRSLTDSSTEGRAAEAAAAAAGAAGAAAGATTAAADEPATAVDAAAADAAAEGDAAARARAARARHRACRRSSCSVRAKDGGDRAGVAADEATTSRAPDGADNADDERDS